MMTPNDRAEELAESTIDLGVLHARCTLQIIPRLLKSGYSDFVVCPAWELTYFGPDPCVENRIVLPSP
jgi:hypothetical protein